MFCSWLCAFYTLRFILSWTWRVSLRQWQCGLYIFFFFFLLKFQTPVTLCSGVEWSIVGVRLAHSADLRSRLRHVFSAPSVACSEGLFPGGHPSMYKPRSTVVDFGDMTGTGLPPPGGRGHVRIRHSSHDFATQSSPLLLCELCQSLSVRAGWQAKMARPRPLKFGYHDVMRTRPIGAVPWAWWRRHRRVSHGLGWPANSILFLPTVKGN